MLADYLTRGVKAGLVVGLVFGLFMTVVANPVIAFADEQNHAASEGGHGHGGDGAHHEAGGHGGDGAHHGGAVSTAVNKTVSVVASGLWAVLFGGVVFGIGYYFLEPAIPGTGKTKSYVLGAAGFVTVSGAPWLVLPPASPGAQQSLPTDTRILLYGGMMLAGALVCLLAGFTYNRVDQSNGRALAAVAALLPFGLLAVPAVLAPTNAVQGALAPGLRSGVIGLIVFGQILVWLLLAAVHAQLQPTDEPGVDISAPSTDATPTAD